MTPSAPLIPKDAMTSSAALPQTAYAGPIGIRSTNKFDRQAVYHTKPKSAPNLVQTEGNALPRIGRRENIDRLPIINGTRIGILVLTIASLLLDQTGPLNQNSRFWAAVIGVYFLVCVLAFFESLDTWTSHFVGSWLLWIDIAVWTLLIAVSSSANAVQFFGLLFAILLVAVEFGFATGVRATLLSLALMLLQMAIRTFWFEGGASGIHPFSIASVALLGPSLAYWGGTTKRDREKFALFTKVCKLSNPRFGIERALSAISSELQKFYNADECLLVLSASGNKDYSLYRAPQSVSPDSIHAEKVDPKFGKKLLSLPSSVGAVYRDDESPGVLLSLMERGLSSSL